MTMERRLNYLAAADDCPLWQDFDFSAAAGMYSQLAGVLAGFAFMAITLVLNRSHRRQALGVGDPREERLQDSRCVAAMACAFLGLVATTALYATASAEQGCALTNGRAASEEVLAGVAFAFSLYTLLFAAVQLVSASALGSHIRFIVSVITPPIVVVFVLTSLDDLALSLAGPPEATGVSGPLEPQWTAASKSLWDNANAVGIWLTLAVVAVCAAVWGWGIRLRRAEGSPAKLVVATQVGLPYLSLALVLYTVWRALSLSPIDPSAHISPAEAWWLVGISVAVAVAHSLCLSIERGADRDLGS
jgi:hypothetical protein